VAGRTPAGYGPGIGTPFVERTPPATNHCSKCIVLSDNRFSAADSATAENKYKKRTAGAGVPPSRAKQSG